MINRDEALKKLESIPKLNRTDLIALMTSLYNPATDGASPQVHSRKYIRLHTDEIQTWTEGRLREIAGVAAPVVAAPPVVRTPAPIPVAEVVPEVVPTEAPATRTRRPRTPAKAPDAVVAETIQTAPAAAPAGVTVDLTPVIHRIDLLGNESDKTGKRVEELMMKLASLKDDVDAVLANQKLIMGALTAICAAPPIEILGPDEDLSVFVLDDVQGNV